MQFKILIKCFASIVATTTGYKTTVSDIIITEQGQLWIKQ